MNVFAKRERSWRKARKRGVSPIIATILLVAITVVLAAVLYVLISGLTHGAGSAPLGTNFSWGTPVNATGTVVENACTATSAHYCYSIEIAGVGGGITTSNIVLSLRNSAGATIAWPSGGVSIYLLTATASAYVASYSTASSGWTPVAPFNGALAGGDSIVVYTTTVGAGQGLFGEQIVAVGGSGYSGSVPSNAFS
jgi:archaeal type IV pilus assembly protein PilA